MPRSFRRPARAQSMPPSSCAPAAAFIARVVDNQLVAAGLAGEVAIDDSWLQIALLASLAQHTIQARAELFLYQAGKFRAMGFAAPVQAIERIEIHTGSDILDANAFQ